MWGCEGVWAGEGERDVGNMGFLQVLKNFQSLFLTRNATSY